ncbi:MAG: GNAT family N-acetyltransferase [Oscillospiraceae bacterium]|jgi:predicted N-acetyltransferase YhbS|nr:GNAT family N-acetyltransferase [Oscillospiraceae bacterium]
MSFTITIRPETPRDYYAVELLSRDASSGYYRDEADAHLHAHKTRKHRLFVPGLDFVAELDGRLAGSIMYTKSKIVMKGKTYRDTLCLQRLSVAPWAQGRGVGTALVRHTLPLAREMGCRAILFHGNPDYYPRLGFRPAFAFGIGRELKEHFHCMPLYEGALDGISHGRHLEMNVRLPKWQVRRFNRRFPAPDLSWVKPIGILLSQLEPPARKAIAGLGLKTLYQMCRQSEAGIKAMPGMDEAALETIRRVMRECNYGWGRGGQSCA